MQEDSMLEKSLIEQQQHLEYTKLYYLHQDSITIKVSEINTHTARTQPQSQQADKHQMVEK